MTITFNKKTGTFEIKEITKGKLMAIINSLDKLEKPSLLQLEAQLQLKNSLLDFNQ